MVISDNFVFIHLQKCAGSFVDNLLERMFADAKFNGTRHDSARQIAKRHRNKPVFGTIRNPWDWWVSWYAATNGGRKLRGPNAERVRSSSFEEFWDTIFSTTDSFGELKMARINELGIGPYTYRFVQRYFKDPEAVLSNWDVDEIKANINELMCPIHLCRVEDLKKELVRFFDSINLQLDEEQLFMLMNAPIDNASKHDLTPTYYDDKMSALVKEKDRLIVELYGYSP